MYGSVCIQIEKRAYSFPECEIRAIDLGLGVIRKGAYHIIPVLHGISRGFVLKVIVAYTEIKHIQKTVIQRDSVTARFVQIGIPRRI